MCFGIGKGIGCRCFIVVLMVWAVVDENPAWRTSLPSLISSNGRISSIVVLNLTVSSSVLLQCKVVSSCPGSFLLFLHVIGLGSLSCQSSLVALQSFLDARWSVHSSHW